MEIKEIFDEIKQNKVIKRLLWVLCLIVFIIISARYNKYKGMREMYELGRESFKAGDYENAEQYFKNALWMDHTKGQECRIRINEALSITTPITEDTVNAENINEKIERLEEAQTILCDNGCANMNDTNGHNKKAQKLKEEIDEYIEYLKNKVKEEEEKKAEEQKKAEEEKANSDKTQKKNATSEEEKKAKEEEQKALEEQKAKEEEERKAKEKEQQEFEKKQSELEAQFEKIEQQGLKERNETLELYDSYGSDLSFSDRNW